MKIKILSLFVVLALMSSCGGDKPTESKTPAEAPKSMVKKVEAKEEAPAPAADAGDDMSNKGIGPIKSLKLEAIDDALAAEGRKVYKSKCTACHKISKRFIGPSPKGIMERRSPEWIMNMILNPEEMVEKDPIAKALLEEYSAPMANQNLTEDEARSVLEYFRTLK